MKQIVIIVLLLASFSSYGKYYPGTLVFENGKSRDGFIDTNLGDVVFFKGWMESEPEEISATGIKTIWIKTNGGHKMHQYHYLPVDEGSAKGSNRMWLKLVEKGVVSLYAQESISQQDGVDKSEVLDFYCIREGETTAKHIASHNNNHVFKSKATQFFSDRPLLVEKIKSKEYNWENVQLLVHAYNQGL